MKKFIVILSAAIMCSCGIYKPYTRPEVMTDNLYGAGVETADTLNLGYLGWRELFTDPQLQALIEQGLAYNTDLQSAQWRVRRPRRHSKPRVCRCSPRSTWRPRAA